MASSISCVRLTFGPFPIVRAILTPHSPKSSNLTPYQSSPRSVQSSPPKPSHHEGKPHALLCRPALPSSLCSSVSAPPSPPTADRVVSFWAADGSTKVDSHGKPLVLHEDPRYQKRNSVWDASTGAVTLEGARNEYVAFQLIIDGESTGLKNVTVTPADLKSGGALIPASRYALYGEWYTKVTQPSQSPMYSMGKGDYPDALIPMSLPKFDTFDVPANTTQGIWVDLYIPTAARAGEYEGTIALKADGCAPTNVSVRLTVWDFAIPAESHLRWRIGYTDFFASGNNVPLDRHTGKVSQEFLDLELKLYRMCHAHRITPTTHYTSPIPDFTGTGEGLSIDWASYDKRFGKYLDGTAFDDGVPVNIFSLPVNCQSYDGWPSGTGRRSKVDLASLKKAMELTAAHWREKKWDLGNAFVYVADEPSPQSFQVIKDHCRVIKEAAPEVHRSVALYRVFGPNAPQVVAQFRGFINQWDIAGDYMNRSALADVQADGDWVGIYQGSEPFEGGEALDMDGLAFTTWPWIAYIYDLDTLFLYSATEWGSPDIWTQPKNHGWVTNSQGVMLYPGPKIGVDETLPSIRLKAARRGMQDYEYFWLLKEQGKGDLAKTIARRIIKSALDDAAAPIGEKNFGPGKWDRDPASWQAARREMAQAIMSGNGK